MNHDVFLLDELEKSYLRAGQPKRVLVAVSGGADSMALAYALYLLSLKMGFFLVCAHVNHGLRKEADHDEALCRDFCEGLHLPFASVRVKVSPEGNLEEMARVSRYQALREFQHQFSADVIALAHHAGDQAETLLMHLMRGAGTEGLSGMAELREGLWRPFLEVEKQALVSFLEGHEIAWVEDQSNTCLDFLRNDLRQRVFPMLEKRSPHVALHFARTARILNEERDYFTRYTENWLKSWARRVGPCPFLLLEALLKEDQAMQKRLIRGFCQSLQAELDYDQTLLAFRCVHSEQAVKQLNLSGDRYLYKSSKRLHLIDPRSRATQALGECLKEDWSRGTLGDGKRRAVFDADLLAGASLRTPEAGDRIRPLGLDGSQSLNKYFSNHQVDWPFRAHWPVLARENEVFWVIGIGIAQSAALNPSTKHHLALYYRGRLPDQLEEGQGI